MSGWSLEDAIAIAGGPAGPHTCFEALPPQDFDCVAENLQVFNLHLEQIAREAVARGAAPPFDWAIALTASSSLACTVRRLEERYAILVPIGAVARIRMMARLLLSYWHVENPPRVIRSPVDAIEDGTESVPPLLRGLFVEDVDMTELRLGLLVLDRVIKLDPVFEPDVRELTHLAVTWLITHEFTHVLHGHFDVLAAAGDERRDRLLRGCELDADDGATAISLLVMDRAIRMARSLGQEASMDTGLLRLGYAVTMLLGMFDVVRKHFPAYAHGAYNHPLLRCELFFSAIDRAVQEPAEVKAKFLHSVTEGWKRCIHAYDMLTVEAMAGRFGSLPPGRHPAPLHAMLYGVLGGPTDTALRGLMAEAGTLLTEIRAQLPAFQHGGGSEPA